MQAIYILLLALVLSMLLIPPLKRLAGPLKLTDQPNARKIHSGAIPRTGGIAIAAGTLIPVLMLVPLTQGAVAFAIAGTLLFLAGLLDDRLDLDYRLKLIGQIAAALIVVIGGGIQIEKLPFVEVSQPHPAWSVPLTVLVLVAITNAVNLSDGLDGLAGGISVLALGCLAVFAIQTEDRTAFALALAMMGATLGFLRFNSNPAQIFMGDSGSQFLGFGTGVLAIMITQRPDSALGPLTPLLLLGIPVLDTLSVIIRRLASGRSPFAPDRLHLHHNLLDAGLSQTQAVTLVYLAQSLAVGLAYVLRFSSDAAVLAAYAVFCMGVLYGLKVAIRHGQMTSSAPDRPGRARRSPLLGLIETKSGLLAETARKALGLIVPAILAGGALLATDVTLDIAMLAAALGLAVVLAPMLSAPAQTAVERVVTYAACVIVVFLSSQRLEQLLGGVALAGVFLLVALLAGTWVRAAAATFRTSSLDTLVLIAVTLLPLISESFAKHVAILVLEAVVLFYAAEVLLAQGPKRRILLRSALLLCFVALVLKGFNAQ